MTVEDKVGHAAYAMLLLGMAMVSSKVPAGWAVYAVGDLAWIWVGWRMRMTSIVAWQVAFAALSIYGWSSWR